MNFSPLRALAAGLTKAGIVNRGAMRIATAMALLLFSVDSVRAEDVPGLSPLGRLLFQDISLSASYGHADSVSITDSAATAPQLKIAVKEGPTTSFGFSITKPIFSQFLDVREDQFRVTMPKELQKGTPKTANVPMLRDLVINRIFLDAKWNYEDTITVRRDGLRNDVENKTRYGIGVLYKIDLGYFARRLPVPSLRE